MALHRGTHHCAWEVRTAFCILPGESACRQTKRAGAHPRAALRPGASAFPVASSFRSSNAPPRWFAIASGGSLRRR